MRKLNYLLLTLILMVSGTGLFAQDTITSLIISEMATGNYPGVYVELTNMGDAPVQLNEFKLQNLRDRNFQFLKDGDEVRLVEGQSEWGSYLRLPDTLLPVGESWLVLSVQDNWNGTGRKHAVPVQSPDIARVADYLFSFYDWSGGTDKFKEYPVIPEIGCFGFDSVHDQEGFMFGRAAEAFALFWEPSDTIRVMTDQVLAEVDWSIGRVRNDYDNSTLATTAGIVGAHVDYNLVRKFSIKEGETNWTLARGDNAANSSWILIPKNKDLGHKSFTTEGNHGNFSLDYESDTYVEDETAGTLTVPWGTEKFDSIINGFTLGKGMAWEYIQNTNEADSLSMICKDGDVLRFYACGNDVTTKDLIIKVADPLESDKTVFAKRGYNYPDVEADDYVPGEEVAFIGEGRGRYVVDEFDNVMDTVGFVPFATPVDTFFRLLEKPPNAEWEIVFKSGEVSSEVSEGDILRVTAADATTKDYHIQIEGYIGSDNVGLASITWPDRPAVNMTGWGYDGFSDTIPGFTEAGSSYSILLPPGIETVPALVVTTSDLNTKVEMVRAKSLKGGSDERTTYIYLTSETDTSFSTVKVLFDVLNPTPQKFIGDPIFNMFNIRDWWGGGGVEICNPTDVVINLSDYMISRVRTGNTKALAVEFGWELDSNSWLNRYQKYVPGYKWGTWTEWQADPGWLTPDAVDAFVDPKGTFSMWRLRGIRGSWDKNEYLETVINVFLSGSFNEDPGVWYNPWNEPINSGNSAAYPVHQNGSGDPQGAYYLLKIKNDSILEGTKKAYDEDGNSVNDYEVVDVMGSTVAPWNINGYIVPGNTTPGWFPQGECFIMVRRPWVYFGDTVIDIYPVGGNHLTNPDSSTWFVNQSYESNASNPKYSRNRNEKLLGAHPLDPITGHLSIVYSLVYNVSRGFSDAETIDGVSKGETVTAFLSNIIKPDVTQVLKVMSGTTEKTGTAAMAEGDILEVSSKTGNVTKYTISIVAIGGDPGLTALDTTVTVTAAAPYEVGGFTFGASLKTILSKLVKADSTAIINILNQDDELVPQTIANSLGDKVDVVASPDHILEVIAEDGTTREYALKPATAPTDAFLLSDVYEVLETPAQIVREIPFGTGVETFLAGIVPSAGADVELQTSTGQVRGSYGRVGYGDQVIVTSSDGNTTSVYKLQFVGSVLAYVTSDTYVVDQENLEITNIVGEVTVGTFFANIKPSTGSTVTLFDADGAKKTTGNLLATDVLYVVSADQVNNVTYAIKINATFVDNVVSDALNVYPNPVSKVLYVENVPAGTFVRISDITGRTAMIHRADEVSRGIDLSELSNGVYLLSIEKDGEKIATTRFIKK
ncbi:T9SS type A sorting domain-containing protein [Bacteroidota bacterium]